MDDIAYAIMEMKSLCDSWFTNPMIRPYSGANRECMYCGATEGRDGSIDHSTADCPYIKYKELLDNLEC